MKILYSDNDIIVCLKPERVLSTEMPTASVPSTMPPTDSSIARESKSARTFLFICTFLLSVYAAGQPEMFSAVPPSGMPIMSFWRKRCFHVLTAAERVLQCGRNVDNVDNFSAGRL